MTYKDGKEQPKVGDKVLGERIKGSVAAVGKDKVTIVTKGAWDPHKKPAEVRTDVDPAELVLLQRAPAAGVAPARPVIRTR